ncbi:MAG: hypothetical protein K6A42_10465 [Treponema sp.]|nr:hypothetical protein [Treponema sp.]
MTKKRNTRLKASLADILIFVLCSLGAATALGLYYKDINSWSLKNNEVAVAKIYFKKNVVQRKFIDNDIWERVNQESPIYNGDKIRTAQDSEIHAQFEKTGTKIQLKENSLIQIFSNKKEKAIDFLSGEILLASAQDGEEAVVMAVKKKISAAPNSKVKITISKAEKNEKKESQPKEAVVEVIEGEAVVTNVPKAALFQKPVEEAQTITAGEEFIVTEEPIVEAEPEPVVEEIVAEEEAPVEPAQEKTSAAAQGKATAEISKEQETAVPAQSAETEEEESAQETAAAQKAEPAEPVEVEESAAGATESPSVKFAKSVYNQKTGEYNYSFGIPLRRLFGTKRIIPAGSVVELKISGVSDKRAPYFGMAFRSGKGEQFDASPYCYAVPNAGKGFFAGASFNQRIRAFIEKEIENTSYATLSFSYDSNKFDEELLISGFKVEAKIVSLDTEEILEPVTVGRKSAAVIEQIPINKVQWDRNNGGFSLFLPPERILGFTKSLPKGAKIKVSFIGQSSLPLDYVDLNLNNCSTEKWDKFQTIKLDDGGKAFQEFAFEKTAVLTEELINSDACILEITFESASREKLCQLSNVKFSFERVE